MGVLENETDYYTLSYHDRNLIDQYHSSHVLLGTSLDLIVINSGCAEQAFGEFNFMVTLLQ